MRGKIDGADHVDIVEEKRLFGYSLLEEPRSFFQAAAGIEQNVFV